MSTWIVQKLHKSLAAGLRWWPRDVVVVVLLVSSHFESQSLMKYSTEYKAEMDQNR